MLIEKEIVEKWYERDSWVYKNFQYLFDNPLWSKSVPKGFSVCPYFWLSLFSLVVFRPFVVTPIHRVIRPLMKLIGAPAIWLDTALEDKYRKWGVMNNYTHVSGAGLGTTALIILFFAIGVGLIFGAGLGLFNFHNYLSLVTAGKFSFWALLSLVGMLIPIGIHKGMSDDPDRCKVENYLWVWLIGVTIATCVFVPSEAWSAISYTGIGIWTGISIIFVNVMWAIGVAFGFLWKIAISCLTFSVAGIPWWGYFIGLCVFGWAFGTLLDWVFSRQLAYEKKTNPKEFYAKNRHAWLNLMMQIVNNDNHRFDGIRYHTNTWKGREHEKFYLDALAMNSNRILRGVVSITYSKFLDQLEKHICPVKKLNMEGHSTGIYNITHIFEMLDIYPEGVKNIEPRPSNTEIQKEIGKFCRDDKFQAEMVKDSEFYKKVWEDNQTQFAESEKLREERKNGWASQTCKKTTAAIGTFFSGIANVFWSIIKNIGIFFVYMWTLIKAKKQGACPYFKFQDSEKTSNNKLD